MTIFKELAQDPRIPTKTVQISVKHIETAWSKPITN